MHRGTVDFRCGFIARLSWGGGNAVHLFSRGVKGLRIIVVLLLCGCVAVRVGCRSGCLRLGLGRLGRRAGGFRFDVLAVIAVCGLVLLLLLLLLAAVRCSRGAYRSAKRSSSAVSAMVMVVCASLESGCE